MKIQHKNGAVSGVSLKVKGFRFWSALNEGGRYFCFNLLLLDQRGANGKRNLFHVYAFGRTWNWWF
jgi:hypothetical protein